MSDFDRNYTANTSPFGRAASRDTAAVDAGLRSYMLSIYNYMAIGLAITGAAFTVVAAALAVTLILGLAGTLLALNQKPAAVLRNF